jgi:chromosome segregation ATPase
MTKESMDRIMEMLRQKNIEIHELKTVNRRLESDLQEAHNAIRKLTAERDPRPTESAREAAVQSEGTILCDNCDDFVTKWIEMESLTPGGEPDRFCHACAPRYQKKEVK